MKGYLHADVVPKKEVQKALKEGPTVSKDRIEEIMSKTLVSPFPLPEDNPNMTACYYVLPNGFNGIVYSACVSPENFDMEVGTQICLDKIESRIWELEGYLLKQKLFEVSEGDGDNANA